MVDRELTSLARDLDQCCRLRGEFVLRSGQHATEYFDKYLFEAERMVDLVPSEAQMLAGLELGGIPLATMVSSLTGLPTLFVRKQAKEYGTRRLAEGGDPSGRVVLLVEDVITTGGAVRAAAEALRSLKATVTDVICAIDRSPAGSHPLSDAGLSVSSVVTKDLLDSVSS
jgi:orotate phosphoribosyltransferase